MIPTLSKLSSPVKGILLAPLLVIISLLPCTSSLQRAISDEFLIYSNGPCLMLRFFEPGISSSSPSSFPSLRPAEMPLKVAGKNCSSSDIGWITAIDHFIEPMTSNVHLVWADSDANRLWTGRLNLTSYNLSGVKPIQADNRLNLGSRIRSLIVNRLAGKMYVSLPSLQRMEMFDLTRRNALITNHSKDETAIDLDRAVIFSDIEIGKLLHNETTDQLFWIESNQCLWTGSSQGNKRKLMCANHPKEKIHSFVLDPDSADIFVFYEHGKIERLLSPDWSQRGLIITNCLAQEKYQNAKFYTIKMFREGRSLRFFASDTQHYAFRQISLIQKSGPTEDADEFTLDSRNSGILFTDSPNIYDFVWIQGLTSQTNAAQQPFSTFGYDDSVAPVIHSQTTTKLEESNNEKMDGLIVTHERSESVTPHTLISTSSVFKVTSRLLTLKPTTITKQDLPSPVRSKFGFASLSSPPDEPLESFTGEILRTSSSAPIERLPPPVTLLTVTSSSTIMFWVYGFLIIAILFGSAWIVTTLYGLKRNYRKMVVDDDENSLRENLTCVKY